MPAGAADEVREATDELDRLVSRLRRYSARQWASDRRGEHVRAVAAELAAVAAPGRPLPVVPDHALADVVAVLGADALAASSPEQVRRILRAALDATR